MALLEPTLAPAPVICDEPFDAVDPAITMAPVGLPVMKPGVLAWIDVGKLPRKRKLAREKPTRAVLSRCGEKTCCS